MKGYGAIVLCAMGLTFTGCGFVVNGIHEDLAVTSYPGGANVSVDGVHRGVTPVVVPVSRKHAHVVSVMQDGHIPYEMSVVPNTSLWEWGNLISWGPIGVAVDAWTGGMYEMSRNNVHAVLPSQPRATVKTAQETGTK
ncbi:MAG: PEGA domain-containing protein [Nitrospira sp.]|nr:PEGA domain-containing protein [Nitrospira sp.]